MRNISLKRYAIICPLSLFFIVSSCKKIQHFELSRFISPETCAGCHDEIYSQWENSMHSLSHTDRIYREVAAFYLKGLTDPDEIKEAESCVKCHTPVGVISGFPKKTSDELSSVPEPADKGIQCDYCHSATGAYRAYNNGLRLDPGRGESDPGIKRGPFKDSRSDYHKTEYSKFHTRAEICGTCHDVRHVVFGTKLETTYEEWKNGPYNSADPEKLVTCQGCHMYHRPGVPATGSTERPKNPGVAASGGPRRDHIFTHFFVGGNSMVPAMMGDMTKAGMAEERLKNAARITIGEAAHGKITITVKNTGAGHSLPTGLTDTRQMWLEVIIKDENGAPIYTSGRLDQKGHLPESAIIYNTVFGDGRGKAVINIAKAREILRDRRIPPLQSLDEQVLIPEGKWKKLRVEARLLYRSAPQKILDMVLGAGKIKLPVITMCEEKKTVFINSD